MENYQFAKFTISDDGEEPEHIEVRKKIYDLLDIEKYLIKQCKLKNIEVSYDVTADERCNWVTLNYTSYAGMMLINPLSYDTAMWQMYDAINDNLKPVGHIDFIKNNIANKNGSKYLNNNDDRTKGNEREDVEYDGSTPFKAICLLPGHNKFNTISKRKLDAISNHYKKDLLFKLHPLTDLGELERFGFNEYLDRCQVAGFYEDMYELIEKAEHVYSTHISETALSSAILGKTVEPIDIYDVRMRGGFASINNICYGYKDPVSMLGKAFASPKSGVIHPTIDKNWKQKIDLYLEYVLERRELQNGFYLE